MALVLIGMIPPIVHAPLGETYALTLSSSRVQEYNTPGVVLYLRVANASVGSNYRFTFFVIDPSGATKQAVNSTTATTASFLASVVYPRDFGTAMAYVGNYTINVQQNQPTNKNVGTGILLAGLTDRVTYQRTNQVSLKASGYSGFESVTIRLFHGPSLVSSTPVQADAGGSISYPWPIPINMVTGNYKFNLTGTTVKVPVDTQSFNITAANVTIPGLTANNPAIERTLTQQFVFAPQYPTGQKVQTGQAAIRILESDGVTSVYATGIYDSKAGTFRASYHIPQDAMTGIWVAAIDTNKLDDSYGNLGPALTVAVGFNVQASSLNVTITPLPAAKTFGAGDVIPIYASVKYPDGTWFNSGIVSVTLLHSGVAVGTPIPLSYIPGQQEWAGSYQVGPNDPSGLWLVEVNARDQPGNLGTGTSSAVVSIPPTSQSTPFISSAFLLIAAVVSAGAIGVLLWFLFAGRRKLTKKVKLDLSVVDKEVDRIIDTPFFQRVKKQVEDTRASQSDKTGSGERKGEDNKPS